MTLIIICTAAALDAANGLLRAKPFYATGDNISVPIVIETAAESDQPQFYGCNWEAFDAGHFGELKKLAKNVDGMYVYNGQSERGFDACLKRLRIKIKPSEVRL